MRVGCPKEIKEDERRVALTPEGVAALAAAGCETLIERGAGLGAGIADADYAAAGAHLLESAAELFAEAELIVKVKEPQAQERALLRQGQTLLTYLHLAADREQTEDLLKSGATAIAYETVTEPGGGLPLLRPMSVIAGRLAAQAGATALESAHGGRGVLLGGAPGAPRGRVLTIGAGVVGFHAAEIALGLGAEVTLLDRNPEALKRAEKAFGSRVKTLIADPGALEGALGDSDLVIGAALTPGARAPKLVSRAMLALPPPGAVLVDVAIDQGGCFETSRATTHSNPTYIVDGIVHYAVANMPGAVARTATYALTSATLPAVLAIAGKGWRGAMRADPHLAAGLAVSEGRLFSEPVGWAQERAVSSLCSALEA